MADEKTKVTPEQMGHILFYLALLPVNKLEENGGFIKDKNLESQVLDEIQQ